MIMLTISLSHAFTSFGGLALELNVISMTYFLSRYCLTIQYLFIEYITYFSIVRLHHDQSIAAMEHVVSNVKLQLPSESRVQEGTRNYSSSASILCASVVKSLSQCGALGRTIWESIRQSNFDPCRILW